MLIIVVKKGHTTEIILVTHITLMSAFMPAPNFQKDSDKNRNNFFRTDCCLKEITTSENKLTKYDVQIQSGIRPKTKLIVISLNPILLNKSPFRILLVYS